MLRDPNSDGGTRPNSHSSQSHSPQSHLSQSNSSQSRRKTTWAEYLFILGGLGIGAAATAAALILGTGLQLIEPLWMAGITWTVVAQAVHVLWLGFRHGDWSAFGRYEFPDNAELIDWTTESGSYAWMRVGEEHERLMREDCHLSCDLNCDLHNHDHGSLPP